MKNKVIFSIMLICCTALSNRAANIYEQSTDNVNQEDLISIWIAQNENNENIVNLFIQNQQLDTIFLRSSFAIDNPRNSSYILVYSCNYIMDTDSVICNWQYPDMEEGDILIEYANRKLFIHPKDVVSLEIPIRSNYIETEVYFKVRFLLIYDKKTYFFEKETNKICIASTLK
ncbi:MAG: hypothetical protein LBT48_03485 [Prevotellaceae bacterium]|nr:hypothetical protein [Prevotellaceae bacterium]